MSMSLINVKNDEEKKMQPTDEEFINETTKKNP